MTEPYRIYGLLGSPYSMKMRAILRYRRLPYLFIPTMPGGDPVSHVRPPVLPVIQFPNGEYHVDSTPMIEELERLHPGERSIVPDDAGLAFLSYLLEDLADEWVTKMMFHYRWFREIDQETFAREGAYDLVGAAGREQIEKMAAFTLRRQVGRMALVGCTEQNQLLIEETFKELLAVLDAHVTGQLYLFGSRPSRADFALYGQLWQLASDPTSRAIMREIAPYTFRWVHQLDDQCGLEGEWMHAEAPLPEGVLALLRLSAEVFFPFLLANAAAFEEGEETFSFHARGCEYTQGTFKYHVKCLRELRQRFAQLEGKERKRVEEALRATGGLEPLAAPQ
jgi:glutathione S-transferase